MDHLPIKIGQIPEGKMTDTNQELIIPEEVTLVTSEEIKMILKKEEALPQAQIM